MEEPDRLRLRYLDYRAQIEAEASWITTRTNQILIANSFLVGGVAVLVSKDIPSEVSSLLRAVALLALAINVFTSAAIVAAVGVTWKRVREYTAEDTSLAALNRADEMADGTDLPSIIGTKRAHLFGVASPLLLAVGLIAFWAWILIGWL